MSEHSTEVELLRGQCLAAVGEVNQESAAGPLDPFRNLVTWLLTQKDLVSKEALILAAESAWDFIAKYNFPQVPDVIEVPLEAWLRGQIRPLIERIYMES
jgi:hypothetical protein